MRQGPAGNGTILPAVGHNGWLDVVRRQVGYAERQLVEF